MVIEMVENYEIISVAQPTGIVQPLCIPVQPFEPPILVCPSVNLKEFESPLCDFLPPLSSIQNVFVNLPFIMLFLITFPTRFLYCLSYTFLANADQVFDYIIYNFFFPFLDFLTQPYSYFILGFIDALVNSFNSPNVLYGLLPACIENKYVKEAYRILGDVWYDLGFAIGFIYLIIVRFVNFLIDLPCYLAEFTFEFGLSYCVTIDIHTWSGCLSFEVQPFGFLQSIVNQFINCGCALGTQPGVSVNLYIPINCQPPSCPSYNPFPYCMEQNILYPVQGNTQVSPPPFQIPCDQLVYDLNDCADCLNSGNYCDECSQTLQYLQQQGCSFPCSVEYCLISQACQMCNENSNSLACQICQTVTNLCYLSGNIGNLPCYQDYTSECDLCYETYGQEFCNECYELQIECKIEKANEKCPYSSSS